jgi:hypothetical protein
MFVSCDRKLLISLPIIVLLSAVDACLTIFHGEQGTEEISRLINFLIDNGYIYFFIVEYLLL